MFNVIFAVVLIGIPLLALAIYLTVLVIRALRKYIKNAPVRKETKTVRTTLAQKLRENRIRCKMSQNLWRKRWESPGRPSANGKTAYRTPPQQT